MFENSLVEHRIMLPPGARGNISYIAPAGHYSVEEEVIEVDFQGTKKVRKHGAKDRSACMHAWRGRVNGGEGFMEGRGWRSTERRGASSGGAATHL